MEKFLEAAWSIDPITGEANYDIEQSCIIKDQYNLFSGEQEISKKQEIFEANLIRQVKDKVLKTNLDVYIFAITNEFLPKHATKVVKRLINDGVLARKHYYINYTNVKKGNIVKLEVL